MPSVISESVAVADRPSPLLTAICASVVEAFDSRLLSCSVGQVCETTEVSRFRVSRLRATLQPRLEQCLGDATRRGRRPQIVDEGDAKFAATCALLDVTSDLLGKMHIWGRPIQDGLVEAQHRLQSEHDISVRAFCEALRVPERTFRYWAARPPAAPAAPVPGHVPSSPRRRRDRKRGRFNLEATLPGIQVMGDTTDLEMFGVPLKLVSVQDPGDRDHELWEACAVSDVENAQVVAAVVEAATKDRAGLQFVTDQGKPYVAQAARQAYEALGLEHAPQKEGTPTAKATLERSFGIVKPVLTPIIEWTRRLVDAIPSLKNTVLARTAAGLLVAIVLDAYRLGRREMPATGRPADQATLRLVAQETRAGASETDASRRLTLARIHEEYQMDGARETFVNAYRHHALEDIQEAERALRDHACRCEVRWCDRYFAAILRRISDEAKARRAKARKEKIREHKDREEWRRYLARREALEFNPEARVVHGLNLMAFSWMPKEEVLLFDGHGIGHVDVTRGIGALIERQGPIIARDVAQVVWRQWDASRQDLSPQAKNAIRQEWDRILWADLAQPRRCANETIEDRLKLRATG